MDELFGTHRAEPHSGVAELPLQHSDLVSQHHDLDVLVPVGQREQAK
jgi:hypothetical protein